MSKIKTLNELTIKEFNDYLEIVRNINDNTDLFDTIELLELFGYKNVEDMTVDEYNKAMLYISNQAYIKNPKKGVKKYYFINGIKYKSTLNMTKFTAGQFIDLQTFLIDNKMEELLSVILIPMKKKLIGWEEQKYNTYDLLYHQKQILNYFNIGDANELSAFFLQQSTNLLKVTKEYLEKKMIVQKLNILKKRDHK